jgi:hypothetical protein
MNEPEKSRPPLTVHAPLSLERRRGFQFVEFKPGMTGVIESGRVMTDVPAVRKSGDKPPEAGGARAGENHEPVTRDAGEQAWFRGDVLQWRSGLCSRLGLGVCDV